MSCLSERKWIKPSGNPLKLDNDRNYKSILDKKDLIG